MIASSPNLLKTRESFEQNKSSFTERYRTEAIASPSQQVKQKETEDSGKEWVDKLNNDIDSINIVTQNKYRQQQQDKNKVKKQLTYIGKI